MLGSVHTPIMSDPGGRGTEEEFLPDASPKECLPPVGLGPVQRSSSEVSREGCLNHHRLHPPPVESGTAIQNPGVKLGSSLLYPHPSRHLGFLIIQADNMVLDIISTICTYAILAGRVQTEEEMLATICSQVNV